MIRKGINVHNILILPSGAASTFTVKMQWRHWKSRVLVMLSFVLGSILTRWFYCHQTENSWEQAEQGGSSMPFPFTKLHAESDNTEAVEIEETAPFVASPTMSEPLEIPRELPPYPEFAGNQQSIVTPQICRDSVEFLIVVISASDDFEVREVIRSTWGSLKSQNYHKVIFSIGYVSVSDDRVKKEAYKNEDILRGNFKDVYLQNKVHTMKALAAFKWATLSCSAIKYILTIPPNSFVNVPETTAWLKSLTEDSQELYKKDFYAGSCLGTNNQGPAAVRDANSLWYLPESYWSDSHLPVYASSVGIMVSIDVAGWMISSSTQVRPIHIAEVYFGILAQRLGFTCMDESARFDLSYSTMLTECEDLHFCVIGNVPAKNMNYLYKNAANLAEICP